MQIILNVSDLHPGTFCAPAKAMRNTSLRTAWRRLSKNKGFFVLNFAGLYVSTAACLLIGLLILFEMNFDKGGRPGVTTYRVVNHFHTATADGYTAHTPYPLAPALRLAMPGVHDICQVYFDNDNSVQYGQQVIKEKNILFADSVYPRMFSLQAIKGDLSSAFGAPGLVTLTESTARKYFGDQDPLGQRLRLSNLLDVAVVAVVPDPAPDSHLPYTMIVSYPTLTASYIGGFPLDQWTMTGNGYAYVALPSSESPARAERILADLNRKNIQPRDPTSGDHFSLQPVRAIHYDTNFTNSNAGETVNPGFLKLLGAIGLFLILAACINYTNLSTALAIKKGKDVGVRKTLGATRGQLIGQFLSETFLLSALVIGAAAATVGWLLPFFNRFLDKQIPLDWLNLRSAVFLVALWVITALLSGVYPALVLSGFQPAKALKSATPAPRTSVLALRRGLVVFQFVTAQVLIVCALVVSKQMAFVRNSPLGFHKELVMDIGLPKPDADLQRAFRSRLSSLPGVSDVSFSIGAPVSGNHVSTGFNRRDRYKTQQINGDIKAADKDYQQVFNLQLVAGRWFNAADEAATAKTVPEPQRRYVFVLNETAVRALGYASPEAALGQEVTFGLNDITAPIVGVVHDFHIKSMKEAVPPALMVPFNQFYYDAGIRLSGYHPSTLRAIEKAFKEVYPQTLYDPVFLDQAVADLYQEEGRMQQVFNVATGLSICINILGLVGLLVFLIEQRAKEVGIRKVLGATPGQISYLLSRDFLRLIGLSFLIAAPVAGWLMHRWLQDYATRTALSWWIFGGSLLATLAVTAVAISFQTIRAALVSPVHSLRSE